MEAAVFPKKGDYRQRSHCNPLADSLIPYPPSPDHVDWSVHFPAVFGKPASRALQINTDASPIAYAEPAPDDVNGTAGKAPTVLDVGCGFGAMTCKLAELFPDNLTLGLEIRDKVATFVGSKILALRAQHAEEKKFDNCSVLRTNAMKFLTNYFRAHSISKMFFLFPDPHFKRSNWRRRIITPELLSTYAYLLEEGGLLYFATDVTDLWEWMLLACEKHPLFERRFDNEEDPAYQAMFSVTDEAKKATRLHQKLYGAVFCRRSANSA